MKCPACLVDNEEHAETCFACGQSLLSALRRGSVVASRYEILNPLGKGGMGMVYKAHDRVLEEEIAIKVLRADVARSPDMARRFRSEIRLARKVTHRNVCRIHEYGEDQSVRYISMELIEGVDFKQVIRERKGGFPPQEAFDVSIQIAKGLQAIHDVGIVHRDLKTANIMRDRRGNVRLMDFGIAKEENAAGTSATAAGDIVGTPEYMSPEQARGQKVDARSDIYALAVVIHEIFSGDVPFRGDTPIVTIFKHIQDHALLEGPNAPPFPRALVPVLKRGLAKDPNDRFASADELVDALRAARKETFPDTPSQPPAFSSVGPRADAPPGIAVTPTPPPAAARAVAQHAITPAPMSMASPPTPAPVTPTPQPSPTSALDTAATHDIPPPTEALARLPAEQEPLPTTIPATFAPGFSPPTVPEQAAPAPAAPVASVPAPAPAPPAAPSAEVRAARQQTQRLPALVVVPAGPFPSRAKPAARREFLALLALGLTLLVIMIGGVLVVGRLIRSGIGSPPSVALSATPPAARASPPPSARPRPLVPVEEVVTVQQATPAPGAVSTLVAGAASPGAPSLPPTQAPTVASPTVAPPTAQPPRPATPRPTATPAPRPAEPTPEQVRAQQVASLLSQAEAAWSAQKYDEAGRHYDDLLRLEGGNARAAAGQARAQWAAAAIRRVFALGRTVNLPIKSGKGPAGFESDDVEVKAQDFLCDIGIQISPPAVKPGESYDYTAKVSLESAGKKAIKIKSLQAVVTLNGAKSEETLRPLAREVPQRQRLPVADVSGAWQEGMTGWSLQFVVTGEKGDVCRSTLTWR